MSTGATPLPTRVFFSANATTHQVARLDLDRYANLWDHELFPEFQRAFSQIWDDFLANPEEIWMAPQDVTRLTEEAKENDRRYWENQDPWTRPTYRPPRGSVDGIKNQMTGRVVKVTAQKRLPAGASIVLEQVVRPFPGNFLSVPTPSEKELTG